METPSRATGMSLLSKKAQPASKSLQFGALPIGLAHGVKLKRAIKEGETVRWDDVAADDAADAVRTRRAMEQAFS